MGRRPQGGQGQNRTGEIPPSGIAGGHTETWAMEKAKRARKAETPQQPSRRLRLHAPYLYPDRHFQQGKSSNVSFFSALLAEVNGESATRGKRLSRGERCSR